MLWNAYESASVKPDVYKVGRIAKPQGHLGFGWELHTGAKKSKRVLFRMGSGLPGTPRMSQHPWLR